MIDDVPAFEVVDVFFDVTCVHNGDQCLDRDDVPAFFELSNDGEISIAAASLHCGRV